MALSGFLVPFTTGALMERNRIADKREDVAGGVIDTVSKYYFEDTLPVEQELIEKRTTFSDISEMSGRSPRFSKCLI